MLLQLCPALLLGLVLGANGAARFGKSNIMNPAGVQVDFICDFRTQLPIYRVVTSATPSASSMCRTHW